ncbi:Gfo/Idh/MocA family protein [Rubrimonas cliftonensis]|uniref:Predicted dehydrogenase n=1 Tax=Rubrimonas cliftonensis TaxID=89524 RepID=A0A1H4E610_9RHOB|nr:Gfo/Idh/MocA family oxidoreductase [Rubrimonas cliftonensis]SEA79812.1 Predicted dehydrogenase [Rubrimonas cliftonensis]
MAPLSVLQAGAGYFAAFHAEAWLRLPGARLAGLADPVPGKAEALATRLAGADGGPEHGPEGGVATGTDAAAMLAALRPDILDIVAPPAAHLGLIRAALAAPRGLRVVVCQKPFCAGADEARAAVDLAESAGVPLVVHENFRFQPWHRAAKALINAGEIGVPRQATFRLRPGDGRGPRAYLDRQPYFQTMERFLVHETAVHWIDVFRFLFGPVAAVFADLRRLNPAIAGEDAGFILMRHAGGVRTLFDGNRLLDHAADNPRLTMGELIVEGDGGALTLDGFGALGLRRTGERAATEAAGGWPLDGFGGDCVGALQAHVIAHLAEGAALENTGRDYLAVIDVEAAVYRSAETGAVVETPR